MHYARSARLPLPTIKAFDPRLVSLNALWALAGALEDRDWRSFSAAEKAALLRAAGFEA
jgi:TfoX C-terminal domain